MKVLFRALLIVAVLAWAGRASAQLLAQNFSGISDGTVLYNNPVSMGNGEWAQVSGVADGVLFNSGVMVQNWTWQIARYSASSSFWTTGSGWAVFSIDFLTTDSVVTSTRIALSQWGGAGFAFQLAPASLQTGTGTGGVYGSVTYADAASLSLLSNTWYTVQLAFSLTGQADTTTGTLSIYRQSNLASPLASTAINAISGTGEMRQFGQIDIFNVANSGAAQTMFNNISVLAVPEAHPTALLALGLAVVLGWRNPRRGPRIPAGPETASSLP